MANIQHCLFGIIFALLGFVEAQSAGGGGGGGIVVGAIAVVCCPCITIAVIIIYINNRCAAHQLRKDFVNRALPNKEEILEPLSGDYSGNFQQGEVTYDVTMFIKFEKVKTEEGPEGKIDVYKVTGTGSDFMGNFRIEKADCKVGDAGYLSFYKKYTMLYKGYTSSSLHKLLYCGVIRKNNIEAISGNWEFVNMKVSNDSPHPRGIFYLERIKERSYSSFGTPLLAATPNPSPYLL